MARMLQSFPKELAGALSRAVIVIVLADVVVLFVEWVDVIPGNLGAKGAGGRDAVVAFSAAVLPAAVASVNATRFQSECRRLAERSAVMRAILRGRDQKGDLKGGRWAEADWLADRIERSRYDPGADPGSLESRSPTCGRDHCQ